MNITNNQVLSMSKKSERIVNLEDLYNNALIEAIQNKDFKKIKKVIKSAHFKGINSKFKDSTSNEITSPMKIAVLNGDSEILGFLIKLGGDVNQSFDGQTLLHIAAQYHRLDTFETLLEYRADTEKLNSNNQTAIEYLEYLDNSFEKVNQYRGNNPFVKLMTAYLIHEHKFTTEYTLREVVKKLNLIKMESQSLNKTASQNKVESKNKTESKYESTINDIIGSTDYGALPEITKISYKDYLQFDESYLDLSLLTGLND